MKKIIAILCAILPMVCVPHPTRSAFAAKGVSFMGDGEGHSYTAQDYVHDGLICLFDAVENAGWGEHDALAETWMNLVDGRQFNIIKKVASDYGWTDTAFIRYQASQGYFVADYTDELQQHIRDGVFSFEVVTSSPVQSANWQALIFTICQTQDASIWNKGISALYRREDNGKIDCPSFASYWNPNMFPNVLVMKELSTAGICYDGNNMYCYVNGELIRSPTFSPNPSLVGAIVRLGSTSYSFRGSYHCIRVYGRTLSENEMKKNWLIDQARFGL